MLYLISLGLYDEKDMSLRALEAARKCKKLYLELYTTKMHTNPARLSKLIGKPVREIPRQGLEDKSNRLIQEAKTQDIGILIGGDALSATTHLSLLLEARKSRVKARVVHGSSVLTAVAETGLSLYKFGRTVTLTSPLQNSTLKAIRENQKSGLHTLVLLDIGMTPSQALGLLQGKIPGKLIAASQLGGRAVIKYSTIPGLLKLRLAGTPSVLAIPGKLHFLEKEFLEGL
jgi:diphthine synthase